MDKFIAGGGKLLVCNPCLRFRNINAGKLIPGVKVIMVAVYKTFT
jgi:predicted peroxiredoxin